jgi:hypothetical protein
LRCPDAARETLFEEVLTHHEDRGEAARYQIEASEIRGSAEGFGRDVARERVKSSKL